MESRFTRLKTKFKESPCYSSYSTSLLTCPLEEFCINSGMQQKINNDFDFVSIFFHYHFNSPEHIRHAVLVVGYGVASNGRQYYLVKNSWGEGWGIDGYFWIARNENNACGIASIPSIPL